MSGKKCHLGAGVRRLIANVISFLSIFKGEPFPKERKKHPSFLAFDLKDKVKPDPENFMYRVKDWPKCTDLKSCSLKGFMWAGSRSNRPIGHLGSPPHSPQPLPSQIVSPMSPFLTRKYALCAGVEQNQEHILPVYCGGWGSVKYMNGSGSL